MKKIKLALIALVASLIIWGGMSHASFPVKSNTKKEQTTTVTESVAPGQDITITKEEVSENTKVSSQASSKALDEKLILLLLWFFLGGFAAHRWYAGKPAGWNILFIITLGGCGIWAIIDLINILTDKF